MSLAPGATSATSASPRLLATRERAAAIALGLSLLEGCPLSLSPRELAPLVTALALEGADLAVAASGDVSALVSALELSSLHRRRPLTLHVAALSFERLAQRLETEGAADAVSVAASLRRRAIEAWLLLAREETYLLALLARVSKPSEHELALALVHDRAARVLDDWFSEARLGFAEHSVHARSILGLLRGLGQHSEALAEQAQRLHEDATEGWVEPQRQRHRELMASGAALAERLEQVRSFELAWRASDRDVRVAIAALEPIVLLGWELRATRKHTELGDLLTATSELLEQLAGDVVAGGPAASFASAVADTFAQRASAPGSLEERIAWCERALVVCPRHKLAEASLASYLSERGLWRLDACRDAPQAGERREIEALIVRARGYDPSDQRLQELEQRYRRVTGVSV